MVKHFSLERVNSSPASFDPEKLHWLAGEYMRLLPLDEKVEGVLPFFPRAGLVGDRIDDAVRTKVRRVVEACGDRLKVYTDIFVYGSFFFQDPIHDPAAVQKRLKKPGALELLREVAALVHDTTPFDAATLETTIKDFCTGRQIKLGDVNHVLRVAVTGVTIGPGMFEILAILERDEVARRVAEALARFGD